MTKVFGREAVEAGRLLGRLVRAARIERRWTAKELAERVGVSEVTLRKVERGDPSVALGTALEAASLVGLPLFHEDADVRRREGARVDDRLALLPKAARHVVVDDDF